MEATYIDSDNPIESTYVWFNKSGIKPVTPMKIDLNNDENPNKYGTNSQEAFGFLLHNKSGVWTPYIPAISGAGNTQTDVWKQASNGHLETVEGKTIISIPGPSGIIAKVLIYSIESSNNGKTIKVKFSISFKEDGDTLLVNKPTEGNYKIWLMGNDTFGFTPYDNYEDREAIVKNAVHNKWITNERIRYYDQWISTLQSWNLNFKEPGVTFTYSPESGSNINIGWAFNGNIPEEFSALVINLYRSEDLVIDPVTLRIGSVNYPPFSPEYLAPADIESRKIGSLNINHEKYLLKLEGGSGNGSGILELNNVGQGELYFYLTAFDKGGNIGATGKITLDLRDWLITQGGLLYSNFIDINVDHGNEVPDGWIDKVRIEHGYADLSTELVGIKGSTDSPIEPSKSGNTKSYMIRPYSTTDPINGYYVSLKERFNRKKSTLDLYNFSSIPGSGKLSDTPNFNADKIGVFETTGSLTVGTSFKCDGKAVFFVAGNLNIIGKIINGNVNKDACIFVVGGTVTIGEGSTITGNQLEYDEVNAYILADEKISIEKDDSDYNGLYISGGIHSLSNPGVEFKRSLKVADRLRFPALVVNHHSKYGVLAGRLFGQEVTVQSTEVGLKPY